MNSVMSAISRAAGRTWPAVLRACTSRAVDRDAHRQRVGIGRPRRGDHGGADAHDASRHSKRIDGRKTDACGTLTSLTTG